MQVHDLWYNDREAKYVIQFSNDEGTTWFRELSTRDVYFSPSSFRKWLESLVWEARTKK